MPSAPMPAPPIRRVPRPVAAALVLIALFGTVGWDWPPSLSRIMRVDHNYYVTALRPGHNEIGVAEKRASGTHLWVDVTPSTHIATSLHHGNDSHAIDLTSRQMFSDLKPGMKIHVNGGRDWDMMHIDAKKIRF